MSPDTSPDAAAAASQHAGDPTYTELFALATRLGHDAWIEERVFEICGTAALATGDDELAVWFDAVSRHHGWHSQLCRERLPELAELDPESVVVPPGEASVAFFDALAETVPEVPESIVGPRDDALATLDGLVSVLLPVLVARHRRLLRGAPVVSAASVHRWYGFMIVDLTDELLTGGDLRLDRLVLRAAGSAGSAPNAGVADSTATLGALLVDSEGLNR